jgi:hypothetical protein
MKNLVKYDIRVHDWTDDLEEMVHSFDFTYTTGHLALAGLIPAEINTAVNKAMKVCRLNDIDSSQHFRSFYIFDENKHDTYCEWRMTKQGFALVIMNAPHTNESIARWQWEIVKSIKV